MLTPALRHPNFRWLTLGRVISSLGNAVAPIALAFAVLDVSHSATDLGLVVAARSLTNVALLLLGGVISDRLPRRLVLVASSYGAAVTQGLVAALVLSGSAQIWSLAVLSALNGAVSAISFPASASLMPQIVPTSDLQSAAASTRVALSMAGILGISTGGILVAAVGPGWGIAVDAFSFAVAGFAFGQLRIDVAVKGEPATILEDLRTGWREFVSRTWVWVVVLQFCVVNAGLAASEGVLGPVVADHSFGRAAYGLILTGSSVGAVAGAFIALKFQPRRALYFGTAACLLFAGPSLSLALSSQIIVLIACFFITAMASDQFGVAWDLSLQENVPEDKLARVYSYDALGSFLAIPVGEVLAGPLAGALGLRLALLLIGGVIVLATLAALASSSVRTLERHPKEGAA